ncbi:MAG: MFS transporter [Promethearchaeota archaeon]|nr:MAG: MFS transporter [Candidatus Lokiarchaeota archaeon]
MTEKERSPSFKSNIYKYYIYQFIFGIHTVRGVYYAYMTDWGGLNIFQILALQSYFMFVIFIFEIPSGALADLIGRKMALILSSLCVIAAAFAYSIYPYILLFVFAETLWALSIALSSGTDEAFLYSSLKSYNAEDKISKVLGNNQTVNLIALTISAPLGSIIADFISLQFTMTCLAFIFIGSLIVALTFKEPPFREKEDEKKNYLIIIKKGFIELKHNKILAILCFDRLFINSLIFLLFWTYQPYLEALGIPLVLWGFISASMNITNAAFSFIIPRIFKKVKNRLIFLISIDLINGITFVLMGLNANPYLGIFLILIIVAFGYPRYLIYVNGINKQIEAEERATVLSTINMFRSFFMAIMFLIIGIIGTINIIYMFLFVGVAIIVFTIFTRVKKDYL